MKKSVFIPILGMVLVGLVFAVSCKKEEKTESNPQIVQPEQPVDEYVDLGLPSGTLWKDTNESVNGTIYFTHARAMALFGDNVPTKEQFDELDSLCEWTWIGDGYEVVGPNDNSRFLPALGGYPTVGSLFGYGFEGNYWTSTLDGSTHVWSYYFYDGTVISSSILPNCKMNVRLVKKNE